MAIRRNSWAPSFDWPCAMWGGSTFPLHLLLTSSNVANWNSTRAKRSRKRFESFCWDLKTVAVRAVCILLEVLIPSLARHVKVGIQFAIYAICWLLLKFPIPARTPKQLSRSSSTSSTCGSTNLNMCRSAALTMHSMPCWVLHPASWRSLNAL